MSNEQDLNENVKKYANEAVEHAKNLGIDLDYTNESVHQVENILDSLYKASQEGRPSENQYVDFANIYGCYVGETLVKNLGRGKWIIPQDGPVIGALAVDIDGELTLFPAKVYRRLKNGPEDNVEHLYKLSSKK